MTRDTVLVPALTAGQAGGPRPARLKTTAAVRASQPWRERRG
jgi:hypothetical protein